MRKSLPIIQTPTSNFVRCDGCAECCKVGGTIAVLESEIENLRTIGVPLVSHKGQHFIKRRLGVCPMLNERTGRCSIYNDRPSTCRLFPFDIFRNQEGIAEWVMFTFCPTEQRVWGKISYEKPSELQVAKAIVARLEEELSIDQLNEIANASQISAQFDFFDPHSHSIQRLLSVQKLLQPSI